MSQDMINPDELIRQQLEGMAKRTQSGRAVNIIHADNDKRKFVDSDNNEYDEIGVVLLDFIIDHQFYTKKYVQGGNNRPVCWALGDDHATLRPSPHVTDRQSDQCFNCVQNQFPEEGGPKPCKNQRRVAFLHTGTPDNPRKIDPATEPYSVIRISPTGLRFFDSYVNDLAKRGVPLCQVVTKLIFDPSVTRYARIVPEFVDVNPAFDACKQRLAGVRDVLYFDPAPEDQAA